MVLRKNRIWLPFFVALASGCALACGGDDDDNGATPDVVEATTGTLAIAVSPSNAEVRVSGPEDFERDFKGSETLADLEPGTYEVTASLDGYESQSDEITVVAGVASPVTLNLMGEDDKNDDQATKGALIVATSPSNAQVTVTGPDDFEMTFDGGELLSDLEPGTYEATASADGYDDATDSIEVVEGRSAALTFDLTRENDEATTGVLVINASPAVAAVEIEGPDDFSKTLQGSETLLDLEPGVYRASASADGYRDASDSVTVAAGVTSSLGLHLEPGSEDEVPQLVYRDSSGSLVSLDQNDLSDERFVFHAWLEDLPDDGIDLNSDTPGAPSLDEQDEIAPSFTQNVAAAWVGYEAEDEQIYPVIGADVRWRIDRQYEGAQNSVQFGTADDAGAPKGFPLRGVDNDQAMTQTNNSAMENGIFPTATDYPTFNQTGVSSPDWDGFSWVTLFSPDTSATARLVAVAIVGGVEVGKEVLLKRFAPLANLEIEKTVNTEELNLESDGEGTVTFTVSVTNTGEGDATNVVLQDRQSSGASEAYTPVASTLPGGANAVDGGFDLSFSLDAGETREFSFDATLSGTDTFCNMVSVAEFSDEFRTVTPDMSDDACVTTMEPSLQIVKDFVDSSSESLGDRVTVEQGEEAMLRIRIPNGGSAAADDVSIRDALTLVDGNQSEGDNDAYAISSLPDDASANDNDGFTLDVGTVETDETLTFTFPVSASADGEYCDTVTLLVDGTEIGSDEACLVVATPELVIEKTNDETEVLPGDNYTSTIVVSNVGNATARDVMIMDQLGMHESSSTQVSLVSSSFNDSVSGTLEGSVVSAPEMVDIMASESVTLIVTSMVPGQAPFGQYCDVASFESENAGNDEVEACVDVPAFAALQTQLIEADDPVFAGDETVMTSTLYNELGSNEAVDEHRLVFSFGIEDAEDNGTAGVFEQGMPMVYFDTDPTRDENTGLVTSTPSNASASQLTEGQEYTVTTDASGLQEISFMSGFELGANEALYIVHDVDVPNDVSEASYSTSLSWESTGSTSGTTYDSLTAEITSVVSE